MHVIILGQILIMELVCRRCIRPSASSGSTRWCDGYCPSLGRICRSRTSVCGILTPFLKVLRGAVGRLSHKERELYWDWDEHNPRGSSFHGRG